MSMNSKLGTHWKIWLTLLIVGVYFVLLELLVLAESGSPQSDIQSTFDAIWFSLATITTVGYGDIVPYTFAGRLIGTGFLLLSLFTASIIFNLVFSFLRMLQDQHKYGLNGTQFEHHLVIIGWDEFAEHVFQKTMASGKKVALILDDKNQFEVVKQNYSKERFYMLYSDYENWDNLQLANISHCDNVLVNIPDDTQKLVYVLNFKKRFPDTKLMVVVDNPELESTFEDTGADYILSKTDVLANMVTQFVIGK